MPVNHTALGAELQSDPAGLGYAPLLTATNWTALAALLNAPKASVKLSVGVQPSYRVVAAINRAEWDALAAAAKNYLSFVIQAGEVDLGPGEVRTALSALFPAGSATRTSLLALVDRVGSRAEELFGAGVVVTYEDVIRAVRGTI
jgi:hypothetical protein